jgi:hypothetical protein
MRHQIAARMGGVWVVRAVFRQPTKCSLALDLGLQPLGRHGLFGSVDGGEFPVTVCGLGAAGYVMPGLLTEGTQGIGKLSQAIAWL